MAACTATEDPAPGPVNLSVTDLDRSSALPVARAWQSRCRGSGHTGAGGCGAGGGAGPGGGVGPGGGGAGGGLLGVQCEVTGQPAFWAAKVPYALPPLVMLPIIRSPALLTNASNVSRPYARGQSTSGRQQRRR